MDVIDTEGTFWLATNPEKQVFGRLTFTPQDGARLTTHGTFFDEKEILSGRLRFGNTSYHILGLLGTRPVTLIGGLCVNRKTEFSGTVEPELHFVEDYVIRGVLQGVHSVSADIRAYEALFLRLEYLEPWVNDRLITTETVQSSEGHRFQATAVPHKSLRAPAIFGHVEVSSSTVESAGWFDVSFRQQSLLSLFFDQDQTLAKLSSVCSDLQDLLTVAAHKPSRIVHIELRSSTRDDQDNDTSEIGRYTTLSVQDKAARIPSDGVSPLPPNMLFTVDEMGGAEFVAKWFEMTVPYKAVLDQLTFFWYSPWSDPEDAFSSVVRSAETLIRIDAGQQNVHLRVGLIDLAKNAGSTFQNLIGDIDQWAGEIVRTRINRVVHRGLHEAAAIPNWSTMSRTLYQLVVVHLLKRCGVEDYQAELVSLKLAALQFGQS